MQVKQYNKINFLRLPLKREVKMVTIEQIFIFYSVKMDQSI